MSKTKKKSKGWYSHPTKGWVWYDPKTPNKTYHPIAGPAGEVTRGAGELAYRLSPIGELKIAANIAKNVGRTGLRIAKKGAKVIHEGQIQLTKARLAEMESHQATGDVISRAVQEEIGDRITRDWETGLSVKEKRKIEIENRKKRRSLNIGGN